MSARRIFIASSSFCEYDQAPMRLIQESGHECSANTSGRRLNPEELIKQARGASAVIAGLEKYDEPVLEQLPDLRCISRCGTGLDSIDLKAARQHKIEVFNTPDVVVEPVAEMTVGVILDLLRGISRHNSLMHARRWERITAEQLAGKTVGVVGLGRIGRRVAQVLGRLEAHIIAYDIAPDQSWAQQHAVRLTGLDDLIRSSDIITLHTAWSEENPLCFKEEHLARMKKGSYVVNMARGECLDETALEKLLKSGHLAGAALDVYQQEPYTGPLCDLPNVILTPHIATFTRQARVQMEIQAAKQAVQFLHSL